MSNSFQLIVKNGCYTVLTFSELLYDYETNSASSVVLKLRMALAGVTASSACPFGLSIGGKSEKKRTAMGRVEMSGEKERRRE